MKKFLKTLDKIAGWFFLCLFSLINLLVIIGVLINHEDELFKGWLFGLINGITLVSCIKWVRGK